MYNLAKLLTEEPKKIEKLLILFSKLILTFYLTSSIYGFKLSIASTIENPIPKDLTTEKIIYFFSSLVIVWYVCWNVIIGGVLTVLPMWLLTRKETGKNIAEIFLRYTEVASSTGLGNHYIRRKNIIAFEKDMRKTETLQEFEEYDDRFREYYMLTITTFLTLILFSDIKLSGWTTWFFVSLMIGFFIFSVWVSLVHKYFRDNWEFLRNEFKQLAYFQKVSNVVKESNLVKSSYELMDLNSILDLRSNAGVANVRPEILIHMHYSTSSFVAGIKLNSIIRKYDEVAPNPERLIVVISNQETSSNRLKEVSRNEQWVFIHAKTTTQILNRFEEAMARKGMNIL